MVTPGLKRLFAGEGVGLIPLEAGADFLVRELRQAGERPVEIVVLGDGSELPAKKRPAERVVHASAPLELAFERRVDVEGYPFLRSHVLNGRAVWPMAMTLEWLAQGALHGHPGLVFHGLSEASVCKGVVLGDGRPAMLRVVYGKAARRGAEYVVPVELRGGPEGEVLHARAGVLLADALPAPEAGHPDPHVRPAARGPAELYEEVLFHGPDLQGILAAEGWSEEGIIVAAAAAPPPVQWMRQPLRQAWLSDPLVLDCVFQALVAWTFEVRGGPSLPCFVGSYRQYRRTFPRDGARLSVRITRVEGARILADADVRDHAGGLVARLRDCEMVMDAALGAAFRSNRLAVAAGPAVGGPRA
jgi:hypothetical protein